MNETTLLTQPELAKLIRAGYEKHGLGYTNSAFYDEVNHTACPIFAAFSYTFKTASDADKNLRFRFDYVGYMAIKINAPYELANSISQLHDADSEYSVDITLAELDDNVFTVE